jgi:predicted HicB family RNase H-like nuclease
MSRLTLRLPETLHRQLETLAKREQTSLNQYIVYALARQAAEAYTVQEFSEEAVTQQRGTFDALRQSLGQASPEQVKKVLAQREQIRPERGLSPKIVKRVQKRVAEQYRSAVEHRGEVQTHV